MGCGRAPRPPDLLGGMLGIDRSETRSSRGTKGSGSLFRSGGTCENFVSEGKNVGINNHVP